MIWILRQHKNGKFRTVRGGFTSNAGEAEVFNNRREARSKKIRLRKRGQRVTEQAASVSAV